jgi:hypothetical protein
MAIPAALSAALLIFLPVDKRSIALDMDFLDETIEF